MSTAAATLAAPSAKKRLPKIVIALIVALLVAAAGGGGAYYWMNRHPASADEHEEVRAKRKETPTFMPIDVFTVNLADKDADRFLQVGITFELGAAKAAEEIKQYIPAVRNAILMVLATKESKGLLERAGKEKLAQELRVAALNAMGYDAEEPDEDEDAGSKPEKKKKKKKASAARDPGPVRQVHFSSFLIN